MEYDIEYYKKFRKFVKKYMGIVYDIEATGVENIPDDTNYIMAGNHLNILDSWLLVYLKDENFRFMVDKKLYKYKLEEAFFKRVGTFGIDPDKMDMIAIKKCLELLKEDEKVVIFPEGHTHSRKIDLPFKPGVARIAKLADVPIIPFGIDGTYRPFTKLRINIGEPIDFNKLKISKDQCDMYLEEKVRSLQPNKK